MNQLNKIYAHKIFALKNYLKENFGEHYPYEIIELILMTGYSDITICCHNHRTTILLDGEVYECGQTGIWGSPCINHPCKLNLKNISAIFCGEAHSIALTNSNEIYSWGFNEHGQLGLGPRVFDVTSIKNLGIPTRGPQVFDVTSIKNLGIPTRDHNDNQINLKILAQKINLQNVKEISIGANHNVILTTSGEIYVWGHNAYGQLGLGHEHEQNSPQKLNLENIKKIHCSDDCTMALTTSGEIYAWGSNSFGQLGLGNNQSHQNLPQKLINLEPIDKIFCGNSYTMALTKSFEVYAWGFNYYGVLGLDHTQDQNSPQKIILPPVEKIICGLFHVIALTKNSEVYVWGSNSYGQLGLGHNEYVQMPQKLECANIKEITCGDDYTVALTTNLDIYTWGSNMYGTLGSGNKSDRYTDQMATYKNCCNDIPEKVNLNHIRNISCGGGHIVALTIFNEIYVWGYNEYGQLGLDNNINYNLPQKLKF